MVAALRGRFGVYGIVAVGVIAFTVLAIVGYRVYYATLADTPEKAARVYLDTLNKGDMVKLYDMTRGTAGQTQAAFASMMGALAKEKRLSTEGAPLELIGREGKVFYFRIMAKQTASDGSYRLIPLIVEAAEEGKLWRVGLYLPPVAVPSAP